jgi:hypothetical protein
MKRFGEGVKNGIRKLGDSSGKMDEIVLIVGQPMETVEDSVSDGEM